MTATAETGIAGAFELSITRTFAAPPALVYRLWAEREHMIRWWGPKDFTCTALEMDFHPGGRWRACIESAQYGRSWMGGVYREIEQEQGKHPQSILRRLLAHLGFVQFDTVHCSLPLVSCPSRPAPRLGRGR